MLAAAIKVNTRQRRILAVKISRFFDDQLEGRTIALWGLAFKANTDDIREAPSLSIIEALTSAGARVRAYDPVAHSNARAIVNSNDRVQLSMSAEEAVTGADVLAVITEWLEFRSPDFGHLARTLKAKAIFDGRNLYDPATVRAAGLQYFGIGRGT
jgi:UDPglucose 6-dehydrogenase